VGRGAAQPSFSSAASARPAYSIDGAGETSGFRRRRRQDQQRRGRKPLTEEETAAAIASVRAQDDEYEERRRETWATTGSKAEPSLRGRRSSPKKKRLQAGNLEASRGRLGDSGRLGEGDWAILGDSGLLGDGSQGNALAVPTPDLFFIV